MIKTLQGKFIRISMLAISALLLLFISAINVASYITLERQSGDMLIHLSSPMNMKAPPAARPDRGFLRPPIDSDAAMSARYFIVRVSSTGNIVNYNLKHISSITEKEASLYVDKVLSRSVSKGKISHFHYKIVKLPFNQSTEIIFLDTSSQTQFMLIVLLFSIVIGLICWFLMLLLVTALSKKAILPILRNMEKQKEFVTNAGHELKTPLAIILSNAEAMELYHGESKWSKNIKSQTLRLNELMEHLLTLAKMDESRLESNQSECQISQILLDTIESFQESASQKEIHISYQIHPNIIHAMNPDHVHTLFSILIDNAVKYSNTPGFIEIELHKSTKILLMVRNTIESIPEADPEKLFDRFYRKDSSRNQQTGGYGIGLSAAREILSSYNGTIKANYLSPTMIQFTIEL